MIKEPAVLTFYRNFPRPSLDKLKALAQVMSGHVVDAMEGTGALEHQIKPLFPLTGNIVGIAVTCDCAPGDNLGVLASLDVAQAGDIVIATWGGDKSRAISGDMVSHMMKNKGISAFVSDAPLRDITGLKEVGLPIFCNGITPNSPTKNGPAKVGSPIVVGGVHVQSGDVILGDRDGVVIIPLARLDQVLSRLPDILAAEASMESAVKAGLTLPPIIDQLRENGLIEEQS